MAKRRKSRQEQLTEIVELRELGEVCFVDGHDNAILGLVEIPKGKNDLITVVAYSQHMILENLVLDGMTPADAQDYFYNNIQCAYVGIAMPIYVEDTLPCFRPGKGK